MRATVRFAFLALVCGFLCLPGTSQVQVGSYPFETADNKGFDTINVGNLNVHFSLPIISKPGRGLPFSYTLGYDSSVWYPYDPGTGAAWTPTQSYGWLGDTATLTGYVWYNTEAEVCFYHGIEGSSYTYNAFRYVDPFGVSHRFIGQTVDNSECGGRSTSSFTRTTNDGSGYTINVTGSTAATITGRTGELIQPPYFSTAGVGSLTDTNGNIVSTPGSGIFEDTLGTNALVVGGGVPSNETFTYKDSTGANQTITLAYQPYTVQTNFGCSGIGEFGPTSQYLVHTITYPDGEAYTFEYEATPGAPSNITGRIAKVTLPTGGRISYSYSGGSSGINCNDGSAAVVTRILNDDPAGSTWTYTSTPGSGTTHTQVIDGNGNYAEYDFVLFNGAPYETLRNVYQTSELATPNIQLATCYNAPSSGPPCTTAPITGSAISQVDTYNTLDGLVENGTTQYFNSSGLLTEEDDYDFANPPTGRGSLIQKNTIAFGTLNLPTYNNMYNGSGVLISSTNYQYDTYTPTTTSGLPQHVAAGSARGNLSYVFSLLGGSSWIQTAEYLYDDAGQVLTSDDSNANATTYTYDSGTDGFLTGISMPSTGSVTHTTNATYDIGSGVKLTDVDQNGNTTTYTYDSMLRPSTITSPGGGQVSYTYSPGSGSPYMSVSTLHASGSSVAGTTYLDPYGRTKRLDTTDVPSDDWTDYGYDGNGNLTSVSNPYHSGDTIYTATATYDSLGRTGTVLDTDSVSAVQYAYSANAVTTTDEAGNPRELVLDGLGRMSQVWEPYPTSTTLGLETDYVYNQYQPSTGLVQNIVTQKGASTSSNWRIRTFTFDLLGRMLSESTPEAGTTAYAYPSGYGSCAGVANLVCTRTDAYGTSTAYSYDALNRLTGKTYGGSSIGTGTASVSYFYDQTSYNGLTIANGVGQRTGMSDGSGTTAWSYFSSGDVSAIRKTINGITEQANYTYNADHTVNTAQDFGGTTLTYAYDAAARQTSVIDGSSNTYASNALYYPSGLLKSINHQLTSGGAAYVRFLQFNNRLQPSVISATLGGSTIQSLSYGYGTSGTNNGNIVAINNGMDSSRNQSYTYDTLNRLSTGRDASHWGETYTYDNWGNMYATTQMSGLGGNNWSVAAPGPNNQLSNLSYDSTGEVTVDQFANTYAYDAEGRILTGGSGSYSYDGDGNRVEKTVGSATTLYWPGTSGLMDESNGLGSTMGKQVQFAGLFVWHEDTSGTGSFLFQDHLGSVRITGDATGSLHDDSDYQSFGVLYNNYGSSPTTNHYLFTGDEYDSETSSNYAMFRNLGLLLGRFNRPDPYNGSYDPTNPQTFNRYVYTANSPLVWIDNSGLGMCQTAALPAGQNDALSVVVSILCGIGRGLGGFFGGGGGGGDPYLTGGDDPLLSLAVSGIGGVGRGTGPGASPAPNNGKCLSNVGSFVNQYQANAQTLANSLGNGVTSAEVLAVAGNESTYGASPFAAFGNFFGLHGNGPAGTYMTHPVDPKVKPVAVMMFPVQGGFMASGNVFVSRVGPYMTPGIGANPLAFFTVLNNHGYATGNHGYPAYMVGTGKNRGPYTQVSACMAGHS